jgi:hypothetical protein
LPKIPKIPQNSRKSTKNPSNSNFPKNTKIQISRHYYFYVTLCPVTDLAQPMSSIFTGDYALVIDKDVKCFLRCYISGILDFGNLQIYCIDEGYARSADPCDIYPIPWKFRQVEPLSLVFAMRKRDNRDLSKEQVNFSWFFESNLLLFRKIRLFKLLNAKWQWNMSANFGFWKRTPIWWCRKCFMALGNLLNLSVSS